jgi:hypothetical protein
VRADDLPERSKLQFMRAAFARATRVPAFTAPDGAAFVRHAISVFDTFTDVFEHDDAVHALIAAFRSAPALIPEPGSLLDSALAILRTKLSGSELIRLFGSIAELLETVITQRSLTSPDLFLAFHRAAIRYLKVPRLAPAFLAAAGRIVGAHRALHPDAPVPLLQVAAGYAIASLVPDHAAAARAVAARLLPLIAPGEYGISTAAEIAEALFSFGFADVHAAMLQAPLLFSQEAGAFAAAAEALFLAFAATRYARSAPAELAHAYIRVPLPAGPPLLRLLEIDSRAVVARLLAEPLDASLASAFQAFFLSERFKDVVLQHVLYCDDALTENALLLLRDSPVPFAGNAEEIYVRLAITALRLRQPDATNVVCDIIAKHATNAAAFEVQGTAREALLAATDALGVRLLFEDLASRPEADHARLLALAQAADADGSAEAALVAAAVCGRILASAGAAAAHAIVDLLTGESRGEAVAAERFRAIGALAVAPPDARAAEGTRVLEFLIANGRSVIGLASLARVVPAATDDGLFAVNAPLFALLRGILEDGAEPLVPSAFRVVAALAACRRLATYSPATEVFTAIFPLVIAAAFALDRDACAPALVAVSRRIGIPPLVLADNAAEFVDANVAVLVRALRDVDAFVDQLAKAKGRENARVRAGVCYFIAAILARDRRLTPRSKELMQAVVDCMGASAEAVRLGAARAFGVLVE